jgi:hypothetical protein
MLPFNVPIGNWRFWTNNLLELSERQVSGMPAAAGSNGSSPKIDGGALQVGGCGQGGKR